MNAPVTPPFPVNPAVGQRWGQWMWNGSMWVCAPVGAQNLIQTAFTANGTYMPSPGLVTVKVRCIGGGGGGGGVTDGGGNGAAGGGGGSGGYSEKTLDASLVLGGVIVTIGAGGAGGTSASVYASAGTATSFGALCVANGGQPGGSAGSGGAEQGGGAGSGGSAGTGTVVFPGANGTAGAHTTSTTTWLAGGNGGSIYGGGAAGQNAGGGQSWPGGNGYANSGGGGAGGTVGAGVTAGTNQPGGAGGSGICITEEYCWVDANPPAGCQPCPPAARVPWTGCGPGWGDMDCGPGGWGPPWAMPVR